MSFLYVRRICRVHRVSWRKHRKTHSPWNTTMSSEEKTRRGHILVPTGSACFKAHQLGSCGLLLRQASHDVFTKYVDGSGKAVKVNNSGVQVVFNLQARHRATDEGTICATYMCPDKKRPLNNKVRHTINSSSQALLPTRARVRRGQFGPRDCAHICGIYSRENDMHSYTLQHGYLQDSTVTLPQTNAR